MMKNLVGAVLVGGMMASAPVLACPGAEAQRTASASVPKKDVVMTGVVTREGCPMEAAEQGCTGYVVTTTQNGKFMIVKTVASEKMIKGVKSGTRVELKGDVLDEGGMAKVLVTSYKVAGNA